MKQYTITTTIIDDEGNIVATLEDREITADDVIAELAKGRDNNKAPTPLPKAPKAKRAKALKKPGVKASIDLSEPAGGRYTVKRTVTCKKCGEKGHTQKTCKNDRPAAAPAPEGSSRVHVSEGDWKTVRTRELLKAGKSNDEIREETGAGDRVIDFIRKEMIAKGELRV